MSEVDEIVSILTGYSSGNGAFSLSKWERELILEHIELLVKNGEFYCCPDIGQHDFFRLCLYERKELALHLHIYLPFIGKSPKELLHAFHHHGNNHMTSLHLFGHSYSSAFFRLKSRGRLIVENQTFSSGDVVCIPPRQVHALYAPQNSFVTLVLWQESKGNSNKHDERINYYLNKGNLSPIPESAIIHDLSPQIAELEMSAFAQTIRRIKEGEAGVRFERFFLTCLESIGHREGRKVIGLNWNEMQMSCITNRQFEWSR